LKYVLLKLNGRREMADIEKERKFNDIEKRGRKV